MTNKIKRSFFQAMVVSILLYGCTTWTLTKRTKKKLDGNYTRMMRAILNKSSRQRSSKQQLYGHLPPITKTILVKRTRFAGHCGKSWDELISDMLGGPLHTDVQRQDDQLRTYIQQLCTDTGCSLEDLTGAMDDRDKWRERGAWRSVLAAWHDDDDDDDDDSVSVDLYTLTNYLSVYLFWEKKPTIFSF